MRRRTYRRLHDLAVGTLAGAALVIAALMAGLHLAAEVA